MNIAACFRWLGAVAFFPSVVLAQFTISGVTDKQTYNNTVTLTVATQAGFDYHATLNWQPIAVGSSVVVNKPDFYELRVDATNTTTSAVTSLYRRFIVIATERGDTEVGIPPHVPFPTIQSGSNEFSGAHFRLTIPSAFPAGYPVPIVAWVADDQDHAVRANGILKNAGASLFQVKRGVGSGFVTPVNGSNTLDLHLSIGGALNTNVSVALETNVTWTTVSGTLSGAVVWTNHSRIQINADAIVPAGSSLTVGEGTIVRVNAGVDITNNGTITINGTLQNPVVFMGTTSAPWGGFIQHANNASFTAIGTIFTGSGAEPCWFTGHECGSSISGIGSHRGPQGLISLVGGNCNLTMIDSAAIYLAGQLSHSVNGSGNSYNIQLTRFLMQHTVSGGEFTKATFTVNDSAFIDCPDTSVDFEDEDNDALYLVGGVHNFTNTLFGWTKDDGVDSGGTDNSTSGFGKLTYQSCWFESTFHEGNSLSGYKNVFTHDTVYFDCGQGIEGGYDAPTSRVDHCFFSMCQSGIRQGDNYLTFSMYDGAMTATNNISIYNHRDLFGFNWDNSNNGGWTNNFERFFPSNNLVSVLDTNYPNNTLWNPATDGWRLGAFGGVGEVGIGFGVRGQPALAQLAQGLPVGLSRFCTNEVQADYEIETTSGFHTNGSLTFPAGLTRRFIPMPMNATGILRVSLRDPVNAEVTSEPFYIFPAAPGATNATFVARGAVWRFLDTGMNAEAAWRSNSFDDSSWSVGAAQLGYGDNDETTPVSFGPSSSAKYITTYFRRTFEVADPNDFGALSLWLLRDDGGVVYVNGTEVYRSPTMPQVPTAINYQTYATNLSIANAPSDNTVDTATLNPVLIVPGTNVVAVEIHQHDAGSSDISFDFELTANLAMSVAPRIQMARFGDDLTLYWNATGFVLEEADDVTGPWHAVTDNTTFGTVNLTGAQKFYRLKK